MKMKLFFQKITLSGDSPSQRHESVPLFIQELFIQSEDIEFYDHIGFNISAIFRAVFANASSNSNAQGASTINPDNL